jgi:ABC-2 type transport system permease protein
MQGVRRRKKPVRAVASGRALPTSLGAAGDAWRRTLPPALRAILEKDFLVLRRDLRNLSQLVTPLIIGVVYAIMFIRSGGNPPAGRGEAPAFFMTAMRNLMLYGNVGIALFVSWMLLMRLAGIGFSQEGKNYWLLKTAPVSAGKLLAGKFLVAFLPSLALGWLFLIGISLFQGLGASSLAFTLPLVAFSIAGNTGVGLAFGVTGANMNWDDPRQMMRSSSGCAGMLAGMIYWPVSLALFFLPELILTAFGGSPLAGKLVGMFLGAAFGLSCVIVPLALVKGKVERLGEDS